jgi:DNA-binding Lrp family transcriptional regulator
MILNQIQRNFPLTHRPFLALARRTGMKEKEILARVQRLKELGIIRRIGASFSAGAVGFTSTLCAARVPAEKIVEFVAVVNSYPGVTHNYEREGILDLPATRTFKIAVDFNFDS